MKVIDFSSKATGKGDTRKLGTLINGELCDKINIRCQPKDYIDPNFQHWIQNHIMTRLLPGGRLHISVYE